MKTLHCLLPLPWTGSWGLPDKGLLHALALSLFFSHFLGRATSVACRYFFPQTTINSYKTNSKCSLDQVSKSAHVLCVCTHHLIYCGYKTAFVGLYLIFSFLISKAVIYDSECVTGQHHLQQLHKSAFSLLP